MPLRSDLCERQVSVTRPDRTSSSGAAPHRVARRIHLHPSTGAPCARHATKIFCPFLQETGEYSDFESCSEQKWILLVFNREISFQGSRFRQFCKIVSETQGEQCSLSSAGSVTLSWAKRRGSAKLRSCASGCTVCLLVMFVSQSSHFFFCRSREPKRRKQTKFQEGKK